MAKKAEIPDFHKQAMIPPEPLSPSPANRPSAFDLLPPLPQGTTGTPFPEQPSTTIPDFHKQAMQGGQRGSTTIPDFHRAAMGGTVPGAQTEIPNFHKEAMVPQSGALQDIFAPAQQPPAQQMSRTGEARPMTPEEQARQAEIGAAIGRGDTAESRFQQQREEEFAGKMAEAKAGVGARTVISSLEKEGMTRDEIKKAIGGTEGKSKAQALSELNRLQRSRAKARGDGGLDNKIRDRVVEGARFDTDEAGNEIPQNTEGRAKQFMDRADNLGPDPQSETSIYDGMKPSEKRQYDRTIASMSQGTKNPNAERKLADLIDRAEEGAERKYLKKQADREQNALTLASKRAQTADDNAQRQLMRDRIQGWKTELETIDDAYKKAKRDEKKRLDERRSEIFGNIEAFNKGMEGGAQGGGALAEESGDNTSMPTVTTQQQFDKLPSGSKYITTNGAVATKP